MNIHTPPDRPRLIAFDFDGTLADSMGCFLDAVNTAAGLHGFARVDPALAEELRQLEVRQIMRRLGIPLWKGPRVAMELRRLMQQRVAEVRLFPDMAETIAQLAGHGVELAIATSNTRATVEAVLGPTLCGQIRSYRCGISVFGKRRALRALARAHGVAPAQMVYVGDEIRDAKAAHASGSGFRGVSWGYAHPEALRRHCNAPLIDAPAELLHLLG